jgi:OmpA-OmpF porin, OOP family
MKKTLFAIALATAGLATVPAVFAQSAPTQTAQQGWYVGAQAGYGQVDNNGPYKNQGNYIGGINGGYRFAINPEASFGVEAGYQYLGFIDAKGANNVSSDRARLYGPTLGANLRWNFNPNWYAEIRAGALYAQGQGLTSAYDTSYDRFERVRPYAGVGVGYNINQNFSVGVNYNYYDGSSRGGNQGVQLDTNAVTVAAEYRF